MPNGDRLSVCEGQPVGEEGDGMSVDVLSHQTPKYRWAYLDERNESGMATLRPFPSYVKTTMYYGPVAVDGRLWTVIEDPTDEYVSLLRTFYSNVMVVNAKALSIMRCQLGINTEHTVT